MKHYIILQSVKALKIKEQRNNIDLTWCVGMVGVAPVFSNKRLAEKYAKEHGNVPILPVSVVKK